MHRLPLVLLLACAPACTDHFDVEIQGVVLDGWDRSAGGLGGARVRTLDRFGDEVASTTSRSSGWFRLAADPGQLNLVAIDGDGLKTAVFQGNPGLNPRFRIPNGDVLAVTESRWLAELERWEGCPDLDRGGALIARLEIEGFVGGEDGEVIRIGSGYAEMRLADGRDVAPCYLDEDGDFDPAATRTGPTAMLLFTGLPAGEHRLQITYEPLERLERTFFYDVRLLDGAIAPRMPLYVPFE